MPRAARVGNFKLDSFNRHKDDACQMPKIVRRPNNLALIAADFDFADIRAYPPEEYAGIIVIDRPNDAPVAVVLGIIERVLDASGLLAALPGHLVIADAYRIRVRPALPEQPP